MNLQQIIEEIFRDPGTEKIARLCAITVIIMMSLVQISPIKVNPWDKLFAWIGDKCNGALEKQVRELWLHTHRQTLLTFARECRAEVKHSFEEWTYVLNVADEYEVYCQKNNVVNGVVRADTEYIRNLYQELSRDHRIK